MTNISVSIEKADFPDQWSLAPLFRNPSNPDLQKMILYLQTAYAHATAKSNLMNDLLESAVSEFPDGKRLDHSELPVYQLDFGGLPQIMLLTEIDTPPNRDGVYHLSPLWIPGHALGVDRWDLVVDEGPIRSEGKRTTRLENWMEKREPGQEEYLRFWLEPGARYNRETMLPKVFMLRMAYRTHSEDRTFGEEVRIEAEVNQVGGEVYYNGNGLAARFTRWLTIQPEDRTTFVMGQRANIYTDNKINNLGLVEDPALQFFSPDTLEKMRTASPVFRQIDYSTLVAADMFPDLGPNKQVFGVMPTINNLVQAFATRKPKSLAGFKQVYFSRN
ncbi:hypothetical protein HOD38_03055 [archaeon]|jgi:hypothetical protein|nr:hypothetical protein [archaeon]MBT4397219.1 hypothetical protein [archaeon]MBT4440599.1 hypothetical protein [archaeon]